MALQEAAALLPHLMVITAGNGSSNGSAHTVFLNAPRASTEVVSPPPSEDEQRVSASKLHQWLSLSASPLRAMLSIVSAGGVFLPLSP